MSDQSSKPLPTRTTGLSPAQQKLQALREKAQRKSGDKSSVNGSGQNFTAKNSFAGKKVAFQRKAT